MYGLTVNRSISLSGHPSIINKMYKYYIKLLKFCRLKIHMPSSRLMQFLVLGFFETTNPKTSLVISTWLICIRMLVVRQHGFDFKTPFSKEVGRLVVQEGPDPVVGH